MTISYNNQLFTYYDANKLPSHGRYSFFGDDFGSITGFSQYIDGYILAAEAIFDKYINCDEYRIDILDTVVYPLCFVYRHIVELYIKYLFFKYADTDEDSKKKFIKTVSHKLNKSWLETKPHVQKLLEKIENPIDTILLEDFIIQIDDFDTSSMRMRYPIGKDLHSVHDCPVKLDVVTLHQKMMSLFQLFRQLDYEIDCVLINNICENDFVERICVLYKKAKDDIIKVIQALRDESIERQSNYCINESYIDYTEICTSSHHNDHQILENMILKLPNQYAAILGLLVIVGLKVINKTCRLATSGKEQRKDFFKLLEITLNECSAFIDLDGRYSNEAMCYTILEKKTEVLLKSLETSIELIELYKTT